MNNLTDLFKNQDLLDQALTHKSWVNEHPQVRESNERLEFLGDAILEYIVTEILYRHFPRHQEGYLTSLRANLVNTQNLADLAVKLGIGKQIFLSKGEEEGGGRDNSSLLADTVEALIGALYLDRGLETATDFVQENLIVEIPKKVAGPLKDAKSRLQELVQAKGLPAPKYRIKSESGPDHDKKFTVEVFIENKEWGQGTGKSKSTAEQAAAQDALDKKPKTG